MGKKYYLSECLIIRDENQYLLEHLTKGVQAGIEHFYIYDNMSKVPVSDYLHGTELSDYCTIEAFPSTDRTQYDCYKKFVKDHRQDTVWCAFVDTDEMFEGNLIDFCKRHEDIICLRFQQIMHGANGQAYADYNKTLTERFQDHIITGFSYYKCVVQMEYVLVQLPHFSYVQSNTIPMQKWLMNIPMFNQECQLHHYIFKSFEEWLKKSLRGNVLSIKGHQIKNFFLENTISDKDRDALLEKYNVSLDDVMGYQERR